MDMKQSQPEHRDTMRPNHNRPCSHHSGAVNYGLTTPGNINELTTVLPANQQKLLSIGQLMEIRIAKELQMEFETDMGSPLPSLKENLTDKSNYDDIELVTEIPDKVDHCKNLEKHGKLSEIMNIPEGYDTKIGLNLSHDDTVVSSRSELLSQSQPGKQQTRNSNQNLDSNIRHLNVIVVEPQDDHEEEIIGFTASEDVGQVQVNPLNGGPKMSAQHKLGCGFENIEDDCRILSIKQEPSNQTGENTSHDQELTNQSMSCDSHRSGDEQTKYQGNSQSEHPVNATTESLDNEINEECESSVKKECHQDTNATGNGNTVISSNINKQYQDGRILTKQRGTDHAAYLNNDECGTATEGNEQQRHSINVDHKSSTDVLDTNEKGTPNQNEVKVMQTTAADCNQSKVDEQLPVTTEKTVPDAVNQEGLVDHRSQSLASWHQINNDKQLSDLSGNVTLQSDVSDKKARDKSNEHNNSPQVHCVMPLQRSDVDVFDEDPKYSQTEERKEKEFKGDSDGVARYYGTKTEHSQGLLSSRNLNFLVTSGGVCYDHTSNMSSRSFDEASTSQISLEPTNVCKILPRKHGDSMCKHTGLDQSGEPFNRVALRQSMDSRSPGSHHIETGRYYKLYVTTFCNYKIKLTS